MYLGIKTHFKKIRKDNLCNNYKVYYDKKEFNVFVYTKLDNDCYDTYYIVYTFLLKEPIKISKYRILNYFKAMSLCKFASRYSYVKEEFNKQVEEIKNKEILFSIENFENKNLREVDLNKNCINKSVLKCIEEYIHLIKLNLIDDNLGYF